MTLTDFFLALNAAGIRLANVGGHLQQCGSANAISPEIKEAAAEHKAAILALLPPTQSPGLDVDETRTAEMTPIDLASCDGTFAHPLADGQAGQRAVIAVKAGHEIATAETVSQCQEPDGLVTADGFRHRHHWQDWRLEWLLEVGTLYLRMRGCQEPEVLDRKSVV